MDADDAVSFHVFVQRLGSAPVARLWRVVFDDETVHERLARFYVLGIHSDVADLRIGHGDELAFVGRIGKDLLVTGHARVEYDFTQGFAFSSEGFAFENSAVRQC